MSEWTLTGNTALLLIHLQNAICKAPSPLEFLGHCRGTEEDGIIPHVADLVAAFRGKGLPVIYLVAHTPEVGEPVIYNWPFDILTRSAVARS